MKHVFSLDFCEKLVYNKAPQGPDSTEHLKLLSELEKLLITAKSYGINQQYEVHKYQ